MLITSDSLGTGMGTHAANLRLVAGLLEAVLALGRKAWPAARPQPGRNADGTQALARLQEGLAGRAHKPSTVAKYRACLARFLAFTGSGDLHRLTTDQVVSYLDALRTEGVGNATLRLHLCALRAVFDRALGIPLTAGIRHAPRPPPRPPATVAEIGAAFRVCSTPCEQHVVVRLNRDKFMPSHLIMLASPDPMALASCPAGTGTTADGFADVPTIVAGAVTDPVAWFLPSRRRVGPVSSRTLRRWVHNVGARCGLRLTCTALRLAPVVPMAAAA